MSTTHRDNRSMSYRITERNFQHKRNKIRDSPKTNRTQQPKPFGSHSELLRRRKREKSEVIAACIVIAGLALSMGITFFINS